MAKVPDAQIGLFGEAPAREPQRQPPRQRAKATAPPADVKLPPGVTYVSDEEYEQRAIAEANAAQAAMMAVPAAEAAAAHQALGCPTAGCNTLHPHAPGPACQVPGNVADDVPAPEEVAEIEAALEGAEDYIAAQTNVGDPGTWGPLHGYMAQGNECLVCDYPEAHPVHHGGIYSIPVANPDEHVSISHATFNCAWCEDKEPECRACHPQPGQADEDQAAAEVAGMVAPATLPVQVPAPPVAPPSGVTPTPVPATPTTGTNIHVGTMTPAMLPGMEGMVQLPGLRHKFLVPPFSVLDTKAGYWQEAKSDWLALGIASEVGRNSDVLMGAKAQQGLNNIMGQARKVAADGTVTYEETGKAANLQGVSIFDPVLCELANLWYCPPHGHVLDPFAGGSVRGVVSAVLGRYYHGQELRPEQVAANQAQWGLIGNLHTKAPAPQWVVGDSTQGVPAAPQSVDMVFSCPPYGDLEVYSDLPGDISNMPYDKFLEAYWRAIRHAMAALKPNRFAVWVVGDFRDKAGNLRCFVRDTIDAFRWADEDGVPIYLYNEARLLTAIGTAPARASAQFSAGRKLIKTEQTVLVFVKGEGMAAAKACGTVDVQWGSVE